MSGVNEGGAKALGRFKPPGALAVMTELPPLDPTAGADLVEKHKHGIKQANLLVTLRGRGAADIQVFVKQNPDGSWRVQFRDKHTLRQWVMTLEACDKMVSALPATFTNDELLAAIEAAESLGVDHKARGGRVALPTRGKRIGKHSMFPAAKSAPTAPAPGQGPAPATLPNAAVKGAPTK